MLRFTVLSLVVMLVLIVVFGCKMKSIQAHKVDRVSAAMELMAD